MEKLLNVRRSWLFEQLHTEEFQKRYNTSEVPKLSIIINRTIWVSIACVIVQSEVFFTSRFGSVLNALEWFFAVAFTAEYVLRFWSMTADERWDQSHEQWDYFKSAASITDLIATFGIWVGVAGGTGPLIVVFRLIRGIRLFTSAKRSGTYLTFLKFKEAFVSVIPEFKVGGYAFLILGIVCSTALYATEGEGQPEAFGSIIRSAWCVSMAFTTIGFGDVFPITIGGKLVVAITAFLTLGIIGMPGDALYRALTKSTVEHDQQTTVGELTVDELNDLLAEALKKRDS